MASGAVQSAYSLDNWAPPRATPTGSASAYMQQLQDQQLRQYQPQPPQGGRPPSNNRGGRRSAQPPGMPADFVPPRPRGSPRPRPTAHTTVAGRDPTPPAYRHQKPPPKQDPPTDGRLPQIAGRRASNKNDEDVHPVARTGRVPEANEGVIYQQKKGAADLSGREKQQLLVQRKALANLAGCNDPEGGAGNPNQGRIMAKLFRKCQPDTLGLVSKDNFCQQVGRELHISPADAKVLYDLANDNGAGPDAGRLDARMFREAFQLVDQKPENAGKMMDVEHREKKRYNPETDKDRPAFWKDAVPSGLQEREAALKHIAAQKVAVPAQLSPTERAVLSDANRLSRALEVPEKMLQVKECFKVHEKVAGKGIHVRTKLKLTEVQEALFNCPLQLDLPLKSLQTVCTAADINGTAGVTYSQVTQAILAYTRAAQAADAPQFDAADAEQRKNEFMSRGGDQAGRRAATSRCGTADSRRSANSRRGSAPVVAKPQGENYPNLLQHDMHPEVPPTPEYTAFHRPAQDEAAMRLQAAARERSDQQHKQHQAANAEKRVRWEETQKQLERQQQEQVAFERGKGLAGTGQTRRPTPVQPRRQPHRPPPHPASRGGRPPSHAGPQENQCHWTEKTVDRAPHKNRGGGRQLMIGPMKGAPWDGGERPYSNASNMSRMSGMSNASAGSRVADIRRVGGGRAAAIQSEFDIPFAVG
jgi:hypothetical protein